MQKKKLCISNEIKPKLDPHNVIKAYYHEQNCEKHQSFPFPSTMSIFWKHSWVTSPSSCNVSENPREKQNKVIRHCDEKRRDDLKLMPAEVYCLWKYDLTQKHGKIYRNSRSKSRNAGPDRFFKRHLLTSG